MSGPGRGAGRDPAPEPESSPASVHRMGPRWWAVRVVAVVGALRRRRRGPVR